MNEYELYREDFISMLRGELVGPVGGEFEEVSERPDKRYLMGMLFPKGVVAGNIIEGEEIDGGGAEVASSAGESDVGVESPTDLLFQKLPASIGVSFACLPQKQISTRIRVRAAQYKSLQREEIIKEKVCKTSFWKRFPLPAGDKEFEEVILVIEEGKVFEVPVLSSEAKLHCVARRHQGLTIVTISLINSRTLDNKTKPNPSHLLFQTGFEVSPVGGITTYPVHKKLSLDEEDQELILRYRKNPTYGIGHGCSADWSAPTDGLCATVCTNFLPSVSIPPVTTKIEGMPEDAKRAMNLQFLQSGSISKHEMVKCLDSFNRCYRDWLESERSKTIPKSLEAPKQRIIKKIENAYSRINDGIRLLEESEDVFKLFRVANRAMLLQMVQNSFVGKNPRAVDDSQCIRPDLDDIQFKGFSWHPFQLAFILLSLRGTWDHDHEDRSLVDLIWFPTGGGKTEAYLAVAALEIIFRRFRHGEKGGGTTIFMRYTLRLLTTDQFQRLAGFICALERLRRDLPELLGREPISLGLWVGKSSTQNRWMEAFEEYEGVLAAEGRTENSYPLQKCPVCGCEIVPSNKVQGSDSLGVRATESTFQFHCPLSSCEFHSELPIQIVDQSLYNTPPTLLIGTIDKFAMLTWKHEARAFFGVDKAYLPPSLIIQDELHLITGPLGTIAGVYEAGVDTAINVLGGVPKIICSTATIRKAQSQIKQLYARDADIFPPPGIDADNSFFSRADASLPGRMYLGAMGQGHTPVFSSVIAAAALLEVPARLDVGNLIDTWWTLVMYHNSRRELGKSLTLARDDIPGRVKAIYSKNGSGREPSEVQELSANLGRHQIAPALNRLNKDFETEDAVDILACTNMLSVGVDISRLGLMLILGQPKTTAEYIQASSRVGRDSRKLPGIVFTLYSPTKPRDRSHYEMFKGYHESLYRYVEPTSVTPYALPSRKRALHASFVALVRMVSEIKGNRDASKVLKHKNYVEKLLLRLATRMAISDPDEAEAIQSELYEYFEEWIGKAEDTARSLRFEPGRNARNYSALIKDYHTNSDGKETLRSMRHVDVGAGVLVRRPKR